MQNANSGKVIAKPMQPTEFSDWKDSSSTFQLNKINPKPYLLDMVYVRAERKRDSNILWYTTKFSEADIEINFLTSKVTKVGVEKPVARMSSRRIQQIKKDDIVSILCPFMPENRRKFWIDLKTFNVGDLTVSE